MTNDKWGQQLHNAVARCDVATLQRMAGAAVREETRMWLTLLARMLELDDARRRRQAMRPRDSAGPLTTRRVKLRRAG